MIPDIPDCYFLSRINNVITANLTDGQQVPLVRLKQKFIDVIIMDLDCIKYMEKYMSMYPHLWELIKTEPQKQTQQLTLF